MHLTELFRIKESTGKPKLFYVTDDEGWDVIVAADDPNDAWNNVKDAARDQAHDDVTIYEVSDGRAAWINLHDSGKPFTDMKKVAEHPYKGVAPDASNDDNDSGFEEL